MPASGASLLLNAEGVFTALLAWCAFKENFDRRIALGMVAALVMRIAFALVVTQLLDIVGIRLAGGLLLLWVCWKMYRELREEGGLLLLQRDAGRAGTGAHLEVERARAGAPDGADDPVMLALERAAGDRRFMRFGGTEAIAIDAVVDLGDAPRRDMQHSAFCIQHSAAFSRRTLTETVLSLQYGPMADGRTQRKRKKKKPRPVRDWLLYVAVRVLVMFLYLFDVETNLRFACFLGRLLWKYYHRGPQRALDNQRASFPEESDEWIRQTG